MQLRSVWPQDPIFIEIGVQDAAVGTCLRREGYSKYLGVSGDANRVERLQAAHPELAGQITFSDRRKLVLYNNAEVLILSGVQMLCWWRFRFVRHVQSVAWRLSFNPLCLIALLGCLYQLVCRRCSWPRTITLQLPGGKKRRLLVSRILRQKLCRRESMHFIPHTPGLRGLFRQFEEQQVRYAVLRWFDDLPAIESTQDVDMLVADDNLHAVLQLLYALPGIVPCDIYSESGLPRSDYFGTSYYPPRMAGKILDGAVRHNDVCRVPSPSDYFHSLAYHSVYHKGRRCGLPCGETGLRPKKKPAHDYQGILQCMAANLGIDVEISLEGLHTYLQQTDWGPSADLLGRLAAGCPSNRWLQILAQRTTAEAPDQGLGVFVLRQEAVRRGFQEKMIDMIDRSGFEIVTVKALTPAEAEFASARIRGGNWSAGPFSCAGGPPAVAVIAYDRNPLRPNRKQRRKFPQRTNARLFVKETIRDAINAELPAEQRFNALHSSDHASEAWHLIDVLAPELKEAVQAYLHAIRQSVDVAPLSAGSRPEYAAAVALRRAA